MTGVDIVQEVREAEQENDRRVKAAQAEAARLVSEARRQAKQLVEDAILAANRESAELVKKAEATATAETGRAAALREQDIAQIGQLAGANMERAIILIAERIVK